MKIYLYRKLLDIFSYLNQLYTYIKIKKIKK